ncbi:hypothetical protein [Ralstonia mannitolilytica]|uniref:hypothetical protein n=1 Tax=Ralstonia mannitolilytica TaxID=105219 RepID=UPI001C9747D4|nr:hypothetical protein [Ralstonia mannitolilytica]MBY4717568.1 hypothetical protein [Ralstonia mannitolilytica]
MKLRAHIKNKLHGIATANLRILQIKELLDYKAGYAALRAALRNEGLPFKDGRRK